MANKLNIDYPYSNKEVLQRIQELDKKVGRDIKETRAEEFINSTSDKETNDNATKEKIIKIAFKISKEVRKNIRKMIKGTLYLKKYYPMILKNDLTYFSDEDIINIYI